MRTFHINYLSLAWFWMWFNFIADSKYQFVTVSGFLLRFSVGSCWRAAFVEQRADWGADALCPAEISPLSQHQILWSSNLWTALAPRVWKCLRPKQFQPHSHETTVCIRIPSISQEQHGAFIWNIIHYSLVLLLFFNQFLLSCLCV